MIRCQLRIVAGLLTSLVATFAISNASAQEAPKNAAKNAAESAAQRPDPTYWKDIRPILRKHCTVCHNDRQVKKFEISGGLALDTFDAIKKGSDHAVVKPGNADGSDMFKLLVTKNENRRMPLDSKALKNSDIEIIKLWIDRGAKEGEKTADTSPTLPTTTKSKARKLDVSFKTTAIPPKDLLGKANPAALSLSLKVGPLAPITAVAFSPDGKYLASGYYGQVTIWNLADARVAQVITSVLGAVNDLQFNADSSILAVAGGQPSAKGDLRLFHVGDWKLLQTMRGHEDAIYSVSFRPDGKAIASASFDKTVRVWDLKTGAELKKHTGHSDFVYAVTYSPDGKYLVSCSKDRTVKMLDRETGKSVFTFSGMDEDVVALAYSPDGKKIVSSGFEPRLYWWDPTTGEREKISAGHGTATNEIAFSRDGKFIISGGADRLARMWNGETGVAVKSFSVGSQVYAVAISPDNKLVATGSFDGLTRVWDASKGTELVTLLSLPASDPATASWLALTPQGCLIASPAMASEGLWRMGTTPVDAKVVWSQLQEPETVAQVLRTQTAKAPTFKK